MVVWLYLMLSSRVDGAVSRGSFRPVDATSWSPICLCMLLYPCILLYLVYIYIYIYKYLLQLNLFPQLHLEETCGQDPGKLLLHRPPGHHWQEAGGHHQVWYLLVYFMVTGYLCKDCYNPMFRSLDNKETDSELSLNDMSTGPLRFCYIDN